MEGVGNGGRLKKTGGFGRPFKWQAHLDPAGVRDLPAAGSRGPLGLLPRQWGSRSIRPLPTPFHEQLPRAVISSPNPISVLFCVQIVEVRSKRSQPLNLLLRQQQPTHRHPPNFRDWFGLCVDQKRLCARLCAHRMVFSSILTAL